MEWPSSKVMGGPVLPPDLLELTPAVPLPAYPTPAESLKITIERIEVTQSWDQEGGEGSLIFTSTPFQNLKKNVSGPVPWPSG